MVLQNISIVSYILGENKIINNGMSHAHFNQYYYNLYMFFLYTGRVFVFSLYSNHILCTFSVDQNDECH